MISPKYLTIFLLTNLSFGIDLKEENQSFISEIDSIYAKEDFSDKDAERVGELQASFEEMNGWNADADAAFLLSSLGISEEIHNLSMSDIDQKVKVKVL